MRHIMGQNVHSTLDIKTNTSYSEFLETYPPLFSEGRDPLEADDWLRTIESKFSLLNCTEYQKTLYAAQQLRGPAGAW
jgi:hypothetical protein